MFYGHRIDGRNLQLTRQSSAYTEMLVAHPCAVAGFWCSSAASSFRPSCFISYPEGYRQAFRRRSYHT